MIKEWNRIIYLASEESLTPTLHQILDGEQYLSCPAGGSPWIQAWQRSRPGSQRWGDVLHDAVCCVEAVVYGDGNDPDGASLQPATAIKTWGCVCSPRCSTTKKRKKKIHLCIYIHKCIWTHKGIDLSIYLCTYPSLYTHRHLYIDMDLYMCVPNVCCNCVLCLDVMGEGACGVHTGLTGVEALLPSRVASSGRAGNHSQDRALVLGGTWERESTGHWMVL